MPTTPHTKNYQKECTIKIFAIFLLKELCKHDNKNDFFPFYFSILTVNFENELPGLRKLLDQNKEFSRISPTLF